MSMYILHLHDVPEIGKIMNRRGRENLQPKSNNRTIDDSETVSFISATSAQQRNGTD